VTKKLYVGNLAYTTTEQEIRDLFSQAGEIASVSVITDRETGKSRGFGFVEMATTEAAQEAVRRFNGYKLDNRNLTVNEARPREDRPSRPPRDDNGYGGGYGGRGGDDRGGFGGGRGGDRGGDRRGSNDRQRSRF
jgi:cold-inducible RNA-binding protein